MLLWQVNCAYVCWQVWLNLLVVCAFWAMQLALSSDDDEQHTARPRSALLSSHVTGAVAQHSLLFFLTCNLCTGAVNLLFNTLTASDNSALCILLLYMHAALALTLAYHAHTSQRTASGGQPTAREKVT